MTEGASYEATFHPHVKRFQYQYRRDAFDTLRSADLVLAEFQQLWGHGEVDDALRDLRQQ